MDGKSRQNRVKSIKLPLLPTHGPSQSPTTSDNPQDCGSPWRIASSFAPLPALLRPSPDHPHECGGLQRIRCLVARFLVPHLHVLATHKNAETLSAYEPSLRLSLSATSNVLATHMNAEALSAHDPLLRLSLFPTLDVLATHRDCGSPQRTQCAPPWLLSFLVTHIDAETLSACKIHMRSNQSRQKHTSLQTMLDQSEDEHCRSEHPSAYPRYQLHLISKVSARLSMS